MTEETGRVYEWRIENLSHWSKEVHGDCIKCLDCSITTMKLYPKGIYGQGQHLVVRFCGVQPKYSGELSFYSSDETLLCSKQQVIANEDTDVLKLPPGPKFEDVLSRIRESEDFITVRFRVKNTYLFKQRTCTTINGLKISMKINPKWIEEMKSDETKNVCYIYFSPDNFNDIMELETCSKNDIVHFLITPPPKFEYPFAVEMCMSLTRSDGTVDSFVKKEHLFRDKSPWTFPNSLDKKELAEKRILLFLCLKTRHVIQTPSYTIWDFNCISIEFNKTNCFSEKPPSKDPIDSVQVLSKDLMCLYQDQKYFDFELKCDNVTFPVHRAILSARSPVLDRLLSSDMMEAASGMVDIGDLDPSTLSQFLTYLYTGVVEDLQDDRALKLYYAADKYQVPALKKDCSKFLCANVSLSNVCDILSLADKHRDDELTAVSHDFILDNYNAVLGSPEWATLKRNEPLLAVDTVTQFAVEGRVKKTQ